MRSTVTIAAALVVVLAAAACGGPSREEFVEKANANCKERQEAEVAAKDSGPVWEVYDREERKQRELEPPEDMADDWNRYLDLFGAATDGFRRLSEGDPADMDYNERSVLQGKSTKAAVQARNVAEKMGLEVCGDAFY